MPTDEEVVEKPSEVEDAPEDEPATEDGDEEKPDDESDDEESDDSEGGDEDEDEEESDELKAVFRLFKNPSTRKQALMLLAQQEGLELAGKKESTQENKGTPKSLADFLRAEMGDEYDLLPSRFTAALDKVFAIKENSIRAEIDSERQERMEIESGKAVARLFKAYPDAKKIEGKIVAYMKSYPPPRGQEMYAYMKSMYGLAKMESDERSAKVSRTTQKVDRIKHGRRETSMQTRNAGSGNFSTTKEPANLKEAVLAANKELLERKNRR